MKERPIICRDDEVRAFLEGRKTQLRRPMRSKRVYATGGTLDQTWLPIGRGQCITLGENGKWPRSVLQHCPFGVVSDRLWARECWAVGAGANALSPKELCASIWLYDNGGLWYRADDKQPSTPISPRGDWRSSSQMPRWASRITLEITNVRVERLQDITKQDAINEGVKRVDLGHGFLSDARCAFRDAWDHVHGESVNPKTGESNAEKHLFAWVNNPFVWVIGVEVRT